MKKYRLNKPIMLSFLTERDQYDTFIDPADDVFIESDGSTIWLNNKNGRFESITMANYIDVELERGDISEIEE